MTDIEFVRCCTRNRQIWNKFLDKYSRLIYTYIYSVLNSQGYNFTNDNIEDIFHDIICLLMQDNFRKLKSFKAKNGCSLASWLRQVTINFAIDYMRKLRPAVSMDAGDEEQNSLKDILAANSLSAPDELSFKEKLQSLKDCINALDDEDRYFIDLHIYRDLDLEKLKKVFRISRGTIDMKKSRIIERLRECFRRKKFMLDF